MLSINRVTADMTHLGPYRYILTSLKHTDNLSFVKLSPVTQQYGYQPELVTSVQVSMDSGKQPETVTVSNNEIQRYMTDRQIQQKHILG